MVALVTCKNEEDPIKNESAGVVRTLFIGFSDAQGLLTPKSEMESCLNSNSSKLFMVGLITCTNEEDQSKMKSLEWSQYFSHFKSMGIFLDAQGS